MYVSTAARRVLAFPYRHIRLSSTLSVVPAEALHNYDTKQTGAACSTTSVVRGTAFPRTPLQLGNGTTLPAEAVRMRYVLWGAGPEHAHKPLVMLLPSMSNSCAALDLPSAEPDLSIFQPEGQPAAESGWWRGVVGPGPSFGIDTTKFRLLVAAPLGSPFGSSSPVTTRDGRAGNSGRDAASVRYGPGFPTITPADQAAAHALLLDHLAGDSAPDAYDVLDRDPAVEAAAAKAAAAAGDDADGDESGAHGLTVQWKRQGDNSRYEGKLRSGVKRVEPLLAGIGSAALGSKAPLHAVVGGSMGGMQCLQFVSQFADRVKLAVSIASTPVTSPSTVALRTVQREIIRLDPAFQAGLYPLGKGPTGGMAIARKCGTVAYRSRLEFDHRFDWGLLETGTPYGPRGLPVADTEGQGGRFDVELYLDHQAYKFTQLKRYDANCYLLLSRCMNLMNIAGFKSTTTKDGRHYSGSGLDTEWLTAAVEHIPDDKQFMLLAYETDVLMPPRETEALAVALGKAGVGVHHETLASRFGHDAFLIERQAPDLNWRLSAFLDPTHGTGEESDTDSDTATSTATATGSTTGAGPSKWPAVSTVRRAVKEHLGSYT